MQMSWHLYPFQIQGTLIITINSLLIGFILKNKKLRRVHTNLFLVNLFISHLMEGVVAFLRSTIWYSNMKTDTVVSFAVHSFTAATISSYLCNIPVTFDRLVAIKWPFVYSSLTISKTLLINIFPWFMAVLYIILAFLFDVKSSVGDMITMVLTVCMGLGLIWANMSIYKVVRLQTEAIKKTCVELGISNAAIQYSPREARQCRKNVIAKKDTIRDTTMSTVLTTFEDSISIPQCVKEIAIMNNETLQRRMSLPVRLQKKLNNKDDCKCDLESAESIFNTIENNNAPTSKADFQPIVDEVEDHVTIAQPICGDENTYKVHKKNIEKKKLQFRSHSLDLVRNKRSREKLPDGDWSTSILRNLDIKDHLLRCIRMNKIDAINLGINSYDNSYEKSELSNMTIEKQVDTSTISNYVSTTKDNYANINARDSMSANTTCNARLFQTSFIDSKDRVDKLAPVLQESMTQTSKTTKTTQTTTTTDSENSEVKPSSLMRCAREASERSLDHKSTSSHNTTRSFFMRQNSIAPIRNQTNTRNELDLQNNDSKIKYGKQLLIESKCLRSAYICTAIVASFFLFWTPHAINDFLKATNLAPNVVYSDSDFSRATLVIAFCNGIVDPLIYIFLNKELKSELRKLLRRFKES